MGSRSSQRAAWVRVGDGLILTEYDDREALAKAACELIIESARATLADQKRFLLALSGGSTPLDTYRRLVKEHEDDLDWSRVSLFWGDERYVPADDDMYNASVALRILRPLGFDEEHVHPIRSDLPIDEVVRRYEHVLRNAFAPRPDYSFDLALLGMGADGHTASLFPGTAALHSTRFVAAVHEVSPRRVTCTFEVFSQTRDILVLVAGGAKIPRWERLRDDPEHAEFPAARLSCQGELRWYVTRA